MVRISVVVALLAVGGATSAKDDSTAVMQTAVGRSMLEVSGARSNTTLYGSPMGCAPTTRCKELKNFDINRGEWVPIIRFPTMYTPTAAAAGNFQDDPSEGLAKLSDADINAMTWPNSDGHSVYKLACEACSEPKVIYMKTKQPFVDTARGFGWGPLHDVCLKPNIEDCGWLYAKAYHTSWGAFKHIDTWAANNINDCSRWKADEGFAVCPLDASCDSSISRSGGRCFTNAAGGWRTCEYPGKVETNKPCNLRKTITMSKWGTAPTPSPTPPTPSPTPQPTPLPTPYPTPPTPEPTPEPTPTPTPRPPLEPGGFNAFGKLVIAVEDPQEFINDPNTKVGLANGIAKEVGVEASYVDVFLFLDNRVRVLAFNDGEETGAVVVAYDINVPPSAQTVTAQTISEALQGSKSSHIMATLKEALKESTGEEIALEISSVEVQTLTLQPTPAPTPEAKLDGKSADGTDNEDAEEKKKKKKKKQVMSCFPGEATVQVSGRGKVRMADLQAGDRVLARPGANDLQEPVVGFLHDIRFQPTGFLTVVHSLGDFRASSNHIVFANDEDVLVANVQVGDHLLVSDEWSVVLSVRTRSGRHGMFAPLTPSGTIIVDGVLASNYAGSSASLTSPHGAGHALAFPTRMYYGLRRRLGSRTDSKQQGKVEEVLPYLRASFGPLSDLQMWLGSK